MNNNIAKLLSMPQKIQLSSNSKRKTCITSKQYFLSEKLYIQLSNTINSYLEERCSGLFRSLRSVKKDDNYVSKCSLEALKSPYIPAAISWDFARTTQRSLCLLLNKALRQSWEGLSDRRGRKNLKGRHIQCLRLSKIIYLENISLHILFLFQRSMLF